MIMSRAVCLLINPTQHDDHIRASLLPSCRRSFFSVLTQLKRLYWVISPRFIAYSVECQWQATVRFARGYVNVLFHIVNAKRMEH